MNNDCRICYEYLDLENNSNLIKPCKCNAPVHKLCLEKWIKNRPFKQNYNSKNLVCEVCNIKYNISFDKDIIINYRYPSFRERQTILYYNRIMLFLVLNCCNLCFYSTLSYVLISFTYYIFNKF